MSHDYGEQTMALARLILADELAALRKQRDEARSKLFGLEAWFQTVLDTKLQHRGYATDAGHPHGGAVAEIPEWELRRHLYECGEFVDREAGE